ncbi:MAG: hypothetical protein K9N10_20600 [Deltaproteobacteria bacterium]|nr:hypothetical protein [Deltaproteobacteria bacterium]
MEERIPKKQIGSILNNLMHAPRFKKDKPDVHVPHGAQLTSFGIPLMEQGDGRFLIDMTDMRVFSGIPGFVSSLAKQVVEECRNSSVDILIRVMVDSENTPELAALGLSHVLVYARGPVARNLVENREGFIRHLRLVFDAVQTPGWGGLLFPGAFEVEKDPACNPDEHENPAMLFPFHTVCEGAHSYFILLEYDREGRFLRLTIEDGTESRLFLKRIPHRVVNEIGRHHYRQDIAVMAEQIFTGVHRECQNQHNEYIEIPGRQAALFELLIASGLSNITGAVFRWTQEISEKLLLDQDSVFVLLLSKILMLLEDEGLVKTLSAGNTLEMVDQGDRVYMDLSRKGAMLNISIGEPRKQPNMQAHLKRMPNLLKSQKGTDQGIFQNYRILLIHHATSEVLGFVKALDNSGCGFLTTLFIRYQGVVPGFHLEDMLSMPDQRFLFFALQRVELRDSVDGAYILSHQYSSLEGLGRLDRALRTLRGNYLDSMRLSAGHLFFREAFAAENEGRKLLLVEDGGYLAPIFNRLCYERKTLAHALQLFEVAPPSEIPTDILLEEWLKNIIPATFEHTANGYYHLQAVEKACGGLTFPAFTIATSRYKNIVEAEACAYSIISAVESIFNGLGKCMMHRHALVLGSRGNIGRFLMKVMEGRVSYGSASGLDIRNVHEKESGPKEFAHIEDLRKEEWQALDLFLGVTGVSVLSRDFFEKLLLEGSAGNLFFASGSTKTVEFESLTAWIETLSNADRPTIGGLPVRLEKRPIKDPQNQILQGHHVRIVFEKQSGRPMNFPLSHKDLYLLGDSMPINFLYYGVPGEVIDGVFEELFSLLSGFASRQKEGRTYEPGIYAVDVNTDKHGDPYERI